MNRTYLDPYGDVTKKHVLCQEVGHGFGLDHWYADPTCMNDTAELWNASPDPTYAKPGVHDDEQLTTIYANHQGRDSSNTYGSSAVSRAGAAPNTPIIDPVSAADDNPDEWGRPVSVRPDDGRPNRYVKELGGGHRLITHVLWVPRGAAPAR